MTSFYSAFIKLLNNPKKNWEKVIPYLRSRSEPMVRRAYESLGIDSKSKPYHGHDEILSIIDFNDGYFIECGGNDGYGFDPTYYLEKFRNWRGVIVEPLPAAAKLCRANRPSSKIFEYALVSRDYPKSHIDLFDCNFMSVTESTQYNIEEWMKSGEQVQKITASKFQVPAITLDKLIDDNKLETKIDLLVIDVEGSEEEVLKGFDLNKHKPKYILVEIHNESLRTAIESILNGQYRFIKKIAYADFLYERK